MFLSQLQTPEAEGETVSTVAAGGYFSNFLSLMKLKMLIPTRIHIYSFNKYLLSTYYMPGTIVDTGDVQVQLGGVGRETDNKHVMQQSVF